jgi:hypothetical protein
MLGDVIMGLEIPDLFRLRLQSSLFFIGRTHQLQLVELTQSCRMRTTCSTARESLPFRSFASAGCGADGTPTGPSVYARLHDRVVHFGTFLERGQEIEDIPR